MSFAKPPTGPTRSTRGHANAASQPRPAKTRPTTVASQARAPSVSSTSSKRSSHSSVSEEHQGATQDGESSAGSRPASVLSDLSSSVEPKTPASVPGDTQLESLSEQRTPSVHPGGSTSTPQPTSDPLQVAAQVYPWLYMTSTLEACFKTAETNAEKDLAQRTKELDEQESDVADQRVRLDAERKVEFFDELSSDKLATTAPSTMQAFLAHGDACSLLESEALKLATGQPTVAEEDHYSPMRPYNAMLEKIEDLQRECHQLHASIVALTQDDDDGDASILEDTDQPSARSQIMHVFSACLPVLQARAANLQMAHELLDGAKENLAMSLQLESFGYSETDVE